MVDSKKCWSRWVAGLMALGMGCGSVGEPQEPMVQEEATAQVAQGVITTTYTLSWPSNLTASGDVCRFGDTSLGHQVATNTRASGRLEEALTLTGLAGRRITSIRLNGASTTFRYDDVMLLNYNDHLVMASDRRAAQYSASPATLGTSPVLYSWSKILNGLIDNQNIQAPWCTSGATSCSVPRTETTGSMDINVPSFRSVDEAAYPTAPGSRTFRLVTIGDNDASSDCRHGPVTLTVTVTHEPATCILPTPPRSCRQLQQACSWLGSGVYQLDPCNTGTPSSYYCDMTTDGGGWTVAGWQSASAKTFLGTNNSGTPGASSGWSKNLACVQYSEIMVFNRTYNEHFKQTYPAGTWSATSTNISIGSAGTAFKQGTYGPASSLIVMGCINYNYNNTAMPQWACDSDWQPGIQGHIADYAGEYCSVARLDLAHARGAIAGPWAWTDGSTCRYAGLPYIWGFAIR